VPHLPYGPPNVRLIRPKRLPEALRDAGVALVEEPAVNYDQAGDRRRAGH
jgi:hypothetical protein